MSDLKLDLTGDIDITGNAVKLTVDKEAIAQHLQCRYRTFLGEWFLDVDEGVPYYQEFFTKQANINALQSIMKTVAFETVGVTDITEFDFDFDNFKREIQFNLSVDSVDGPIDFSQIVEV